MRFRFLGLSLLLTSFFISSPNQSPAGDLLPVRNSAQIKLELSKLRVLGSVLYLAAHPDDENTALLAYFSYGARYRVGYLSLTRGDGGQNLIGLEKGAQLGVIRTQELLAARELDSADQFFTRAIDFGYSKSPEETLEKWNREKILSDVVWVVRNFRPDIIVTRFPADGRGRHGHHTASAILALEAFDAAADPDRFPEQLEWVTTWQTERVFWNAWRPNLADRPADAPPLLPINLGDYNPLLGEAYTELAARSRSMHKSQGFGSTARRGERLDYLELTAGSPPSQDPFDGIETNWNRIEGGGGVDRLLAQAEKEFNLDDPSAVVPILIKAYEALEGLEDSPWVQVKKSDLQSVIFAATGLWLEAITPEPTSSPGDSVTFTITALQRSPLEVRIGAMELPQGGAIIGGTIEPGVDLLSNNKSRTLEVGLELPDDMPLTQPYWLEEEPTAGAFRVSNQELIGRAIGSPALSVGISLTIEGKEFSTNTPVLYRWTDRVEGEKYRRFVVVPAVSIRLDRDVYLFPGAEPREVRVNLLAGRSTVSGTLALDLPGGWTTDPVEQTFSLAERGDEETVRFLVTPLADAESGSIVARATSGDREYRRSLKELDYSHIPVQVSFPRADARIVRLDLKKRGEQVGYVVGSGDGIPEALTDVGYQVTLLEEPEIESGELGRYDAIVLGIRAFNTNPRLAQLQTQLLEYVRDGGVLVVQYNTIGRNFNVKIGPYPFTISRDRVTVEEAEVRFVNPDHPLLNHPNKITQEDFEGWVQERGLYFSDDWDSRYETVLSSNDPGEEATEGGLLYVRYGEGVFIYTGFSWFRELPAGVPGAYRLFVNLVSGGLPPAERSAR